MRVAPGESAIRLVLTDEFPDPPVVPHGVEQTELAV
jgi:hypothetical protein